MSQYFNLMKETSQATDVLIADYMEKLSPEVKQLPMKRHGSPSTTRSSDPNGL